LRLYVLVFQDSFKNASNRSGEIFIEPAFGFVLQASFVRGGADSL